MSEHERCRAGQLAQGVTVHNSCCGVGGDDRAFLDITGVTPLPEGMVTVHTLDGPDHVLAADWPMQLVTPGERDAAEFIVATEGLRLDGERDA